MKVCFSSQQCTKDWLLIGSDEYIQFCEKLLPTLGKEFNEKNDDWEKCNNVEKIFISSSLHRQETLSSWKHQSSN
jgi:hypothetical protein